MPIVELPIPTYYGDEICYVNGMKYAWDVFRTMLRANFHQRNLLYDRKFDIGPVEETYDVKLGFTSSHTMAIDAVRPGANVFDIGCGRGYVARELAKKAAPCHRRGPICAGPLGRPESQLLPMGPRPGEFPVDLSEFDQVFLLDIIEHLKEPDDFMERLRHAAVRRRPEIVLTTANIGFFVTPIHAADGLFQLRTQRHPRPHPHAAVYIRVPVRAIRAGGLRSHRSKRHPRSVSHGRWR